MASDARRPESDPATFVRLEKGLVGERLVAAAEGDATHVHLTYLRQITAEHDQHAAHARVHARQLGQRIVDLETQIAQQTHRADQADIMVTQQQHEAERYGISIRRLATKNAALIGEKRRLRDALTGKHPLPAVHYRIDIDRDDVAYASTVAMLETFPHRDHVREALAEARRIATRQGGHVRSLRLDTAAWRAVIQVPIDH